MNLRLITINIRRRLRIIEQTIYYRAPIPFSVEMWIKESLFRLAPSLFRHSTAYHVWMISKRITASDFVQGFQNQKRWCVVTRRHTLCIAAVIVVYLRKHGFNVDLMNRIPKGFPHDLYIVICPHAFEILPPNEKLIIYQLEPLYQMYKGGNLHFYTKEFINMLNNSVAVFDSSLNNLDFLKNNGVFSPHVYHLPVGALSDYGKELHVREKTCDVLFYGNYSQHRRRSRMIEELKKHFNVRIISEKIYGEEIQRAIKSARIVINIHGRENALLEPRIQECLSLGVPVVSETSQNQDDYPEFKDAVMFFEGGSIPAMLSAVRDSLENPVSEETIAKAVEASAARFALMFDRFLVDNNMIPPDSVDYHRSSTKHH